MQKSKTLNIDTELQENESISFQEIETSHNVKP